MTPFEALVAEMRACTLCADRLPLGPKPTFRIAPTARLLLVGQAPGTKVHETGIRWNDRSGDRLRDWLLLDRETFYDERHIAILPTGLCYPGVDKNGGDRPPCPLCAPTWHPRVRPHLKKVGLTLLIGSYAHAYYLGARRGALARRKLPSATNSISRASPPSISALSQSNAARSSGPATPTSAASNASSKLARGQQGGATAKGSGQQ